MHTITHTHNTHTYTITHTTHNTHTYYNTHTPNRHTHNTHTHYTVHMLGHTVTSLLCSTPFPTTNTLSPEEVPVWNETGRDIWD